MVRNVAFVTRRLAANDGSGVQARRRTAAMSERRVYDAEIIPPLGGRLAHSWETGTTAKGELTEERKRMEELRWGGTEERKSAPKNLTETDRRVTLMTRRSGGTGWIWRTSGSELIADGELVVS